ncbi:MAG: cupredoxin domain-containing protein [Dehalococcoidia bacterium]
MAKNEKNLRTPMILAWLAAAVVVSAVATVMVIRQGGKAGDAGQSSVSTASGNQTVEIAAGNGYSPRDTVARANLPTTLKIKTNGDFDCSSSLSIPKLGYQTQLPPTGETEVNVPPQQAGSTLKGVCSMGMYSFTIRFE